MDDDGLGWTVPEYRDSFLDGHGRGQFNRPSCATSGSFSSSSPTSRLRSHGSVSPNSNWRSTRPSSWPINRKSAASADLLSHEGANGPSSTGKVRRCGWARSTRPLPWISGRSHRQGRHVRSTKLNGSSVLAFRFGLTPTRWPSLLRLTGVPTGAQAADRSSGRLRPWGLALVLTRTRLGHAGRRRPPSARRGWHAGRQGRD